MNFLGVGAWELVAILLIMLVFAGPKRMIHWSYVLGQHVAKFRKIWSETVDIVQKEFDDAGVGIKLPKTPPTRGSMNKAVTEAVKPMTSPVQDTLNEVQKDLDAVKEVSDTLNESKQLPAPSPAKAASKPSPAKPATTATPGKTQVAPQAVALGSWSGIDASAKSNGSGADLGAWSRAAGDSDERA